MEIATVLLHMLFIIPVYLLLGLFLFRVIDYLIGLKEFMKFVLFGKPSQYFKKTKPCKYEIAMFVYAWPVWGGLYLMLHLVQFLEKLYLEVIRLFIKRANRRKK